MKLSHCSYTIVFAIIFIIIGGVLKPQPVNPIQRQKVASDRFWVLKTHCSSKFDMILVGDSRLYRGVSPAIMESILDGYRILNFGYSSGKLTAKMYREAERKLDPNSKKMVIVLAVTPATLMHRPDENKHLLQEQTRHRKDIYQRPQLSELIFLEEGEFNRFK